ncbi:hypothetical protein [Legionella bononiensis]|uniref:Ubiquitin-like domain-containing protein n=1 Tax=Legionella bononiensis TaxID=2793102 RepID=A0ABS1W6Z1_9GAMM|nr:hypothetical protein [Legionella bononiensis]MBL7525099.1 hypothetical protein [Legionella bononiensis]MBL7562824.1 hypothetical protein [Legionella bononiensis]
MKLEIYKNGCNETITLNIEPTASVSELMQLLYEGRDALLEQVPFDTYQQVISLNIVNLYSEHFVTKLVPGTMLNEYDVDESSYITMDNYSVDNFFFILNRMNSSPNPQDSVIHAARTRAHFFGNGTAGDSQDDDKESALFEMRSGI